MTPLYRIVTNSDRTSDLTVAMLRELLRQAEAGEIINVVAVTWHSAAEPQIHMATEDRIQALGALRTMEHAVVRDWLDGAVVS